MLRVAVPNKGALAEPARVMLREAGYLRGVGSRDLVFVDTENEVEFFFLRPRDIAVYVGAGTLELGITGQDMLADAGVDLDEVATLGFGGSTFRLAAPTGAYASASDLAGARIATAYPGLLQRWLDAHRMSATVVRLDGAVENAVRLGVADAVADVVDTGNTMRQAGLELIGDPIAQSQAVLVSRPGLAGSPAVQNLARRINGVIVARAYVMIDYDIRSEQVDAACAITPGLESPTLAPLKESGWVAVRAMVPRRHVHQVMDDLYATGARGILVTDIHACRL